MSNLEKRIINLDSNYNIKDLINYLLSNLHEQTGKTIISKIELLHRSIDKKCDILKQISNFFNSCKNDIPLINKYFITKNKLDNNHHYNKYYRTYRIKKPFENYTYIELKEACNNLLSLDLTIPYIKYRRFIDNDVFMYLKLPLDYKLINEAIYKINTIIDNNEFNYKLDKSKYTEEFINALLSNEIINDEYILSLTNEVNLKYNQELLNKSTNKKFFNIFNKSIKIKEEENLKQFTMIKEEIYKEYSQNYKKIETLKEKLLFLKSVFHEDKYEEEILDIIKYENLYDKLILYKRILEAAYNNRTSFSLINSLPNIKRDILKYCYDDLEEKKDINELISIIPILKCYLDIEEEEVKHLDLVILYKEYDNIIDSIYEDNYKIKNLISNAIINVWDNKLRENYLALTENIEDINEDSFHMYFPCIIANLSEYNINELKAKNITFDKTIIVSNDNNKHINIDSLNILSKDIIYINIDNKSDILDMSTYKNNSYEVSDELFSEIEYFLTNKNNNIEILTKRKYMELKVNNKRVVIILDNQYDKIVTKDIFFYKYYQENNIIIYRLWYRNWWINKFDELEKLEEFIKSLTSLNK